MVELPSETSLAEQRRARTMRWGAVVVLIAIFVGAYFVLRPFAGDRNKSKAMGEIRHLFSLFEPPPGSVRTPDPHLEALRQPEGGYLTSDHFLDVSQYWRFPLAPVDAVLWVQQHTPHGLTLIGGNVGGNPASQGFRFLDHGSDAYEYANLQILIAGGRGPTSDVRIDATLVWLSTALVRDTKTGPKVRVTMSKGCPQALGQSKDVSNPADGLDQRMLPKEDPARALVCAYQGNAFVSNSLRLARKKELSLQQAVGLARTINEITLNYPGKWSFVSCHTGTEIENKYIIVFSYAHHSDVALWYDTATCGTLLNGYLDAEQYNTGTFNLFADRFDRVKP